MALSYLIAKLLVSVSVLKPQAFLQHTVMVTY